MTMNQDDWAQADMNMYGCTPCPKCGSEYRCVFNNAPSLMQCDDCGHEEQISKDNYGLWEEYVERVRDDRRDSETRDPEGDTGDRG